LTEAAGDAAADRSCDQADAPARSVCLVQRAEQRLRNGRVEEADADVQTLLALGLGDGDAYALLSIIQVVKNDKAAALDLASRATQLSPNSPRAWIALSYAHQAAFELERRSRGEKSRELAPTARQRKRAWPSC
jgi:Flp pilus assembly protein TadD